VNEIGARHFSFAIPRLFSGLNSRIPTSEVFQRSSCAVNILVIQVNVLKSDPNIIANFSLAIAIMGQSRPWSDRYLFSAFNASQQLSILFNSLQRDSTSERLTVLKRVEHLSAVTFRTSLEGRSTRSVGRESQGVKRSVRVQAFICPSSLMR
jgi:hypothetical protein